MAERELDGHGLAHLAVPQLPIEEAPQALAERTRNVERLVEQTLADRAQTAGSAWS